MLQQQTDSFSVSVPQDRVKGAIKHLNASKLEPVLTSYRMRWVKSPAAVRLSTVADDVAGAGLDGLVWASPRGQ